MQNKSDTENRDKQTTSDENMLPDRSAPAESTDVPFLPLVGSVVFPLSIYPLGLQGEQARHLVAAAQASGGQVALFMQKELAPDPPTDADIHSVGTLVRLEDVTLAEDDVISVTAVGLRRVQLVEVLQWNPFTLARIKPLVEEQDQNISDSPLAQQVRDLYRGLVAGNQSAAEKLVPTLDATEQASDLAYLVASTLPISPTGKQALLEIGSVPERLQQLVPILAKAHELQAASRPSAVDAASSSSAASSATVEGATPSLGAELRAGTSVSDSGSLARIELQNCLQEAHLPPEARRVAERELERLSSISPASPDYNMVRTYLEWLSDLPWQDGPEPEIDLERARQILDRDHYGLEDVKERIIEYLAVRKLRRERTVRAPEGEADLRPGDPVLCLVGPPGIGKTSLGRSIAEALERPFIRVSLGGISDEAEIRGHRRTYLGAMPGKLMQGLARLGSNHPVVVLDELDKLGAGGKGDPAAALLEVLDPEQQRHFIDHYIDVPFDLSGVFFVATANVMDAVSDALRDRLEIIELSGYTEEEKEQIGLRHIIPRQMEGHALTPGDADWDNDAILAVIRNYTREAGVRQLEREIATICRRIASMLAQSGASDREKYRVTPEFVSDILGTPRFLPEQQEGSEQPGVVTGLVWTPVGGDIIHVEASIMPGRKTLTITGQLGEVMRESAQAALSYVRARASTLGIDPQFFEHHDIHLHVPSGAVPKDGPSAGVTMAAALVSLLTGISVASDTAMTGELTLRGRVLPVGGIKEKVLAARRANIRVVLLPEQNRRDLSDVSQEGLEDMVFIFVETMDELLDAVLDRGAAVLRPQGGRDNRPAQRRGNVARRTGASLPRVARARRY